jgi:hypothetical protein
MWESELPAAAPEAAPETSVTFITDTKVSRGPDLGWRILGRAVKEMSQEARGACA